MYKQWLNVCLILLALLVTCGIIGSLEKLPPDAEHKLELARRGIPDETQIAGGF